MIGSHAARRTVVSQSRRSQLAASKRASRGKVGYIGSQAILTVLHNNDSLPVGWNAHWDTGALIVNGNNVTIDHYEIHGAVVFQGDNPTMTHCKVFSNPGDFFGVTVSGAGHGVLNISDTTVVGNASSGAAQVNGISSDSGLVARRCDVSGTGDGIHMVSQASPADAIISQCYVHDQAFVDEAQHCDGIQIFNNPGAASFFKIEHCYIGLTLSTIGTPLNSAMTCGTPTADTTPLAAATIDNNYFESGLFHLRVNFRLHNTTITNNGTGPQLSGEFGTWDMETPVAAWTNNKNSNGTTAANPFPLTPPTIKESLQTTNSNTTGQTLSTTTGTTTAGDTLLIVFATDNNTAADPTSTAGMLTQIGTTVVDGNNSGVLRMYTVPVTTSGSKDIVIPAAGGFDVYGAVMVIGGPIEVEGFASMNFPSSNTTFATPATSFAGGKDLLVATMITQQGAIFDLTGSGLTQRASPNAPPFSSMVVGTAALNGPGVTPTYTFTTTNAAKPGIGIFGLQRLG
ncbi:MAG: hypothetical protein JWP06_174 [Candidatus Saccharibacteria bacterium]|nr:hypothetical protein [Candidatus Saccharibacteria bacterium]